MAETIRAYGDHFWQLLPLGVAVVGVDAATLHRGLGTQTLILWAFGPVFAAAYVRAASVVRGEPWAWPAFWAALVVYLPFPVLLRLYVVPGVVWFGLLGLAVPAAVAERLGARAALRRGWQLARADLVHAVAGLVTLGLVYFLSRYVLLVLIHGFGDQGQVGAAMIADLVLAPLVFVGGVLLYEDQRARLAGSDRGGD